MTGLSLILRAGLGVTIILVGYGLALTIGLIAQIGISAAWYSTLAVLFATLHSQSLAAPIAASILIIGCLALILLRTLMEMR